MGKIEKSNNNEPIFRDIRRYYCQFCGISRSKKSLLASHIQSTHKEEVEKQEMEVNEESDKVKNGGKNDDRTCEECGITFAKPAHLKQHMQSHSLERPFACPLDDCPSSFRRRDHLNRHVLQHKGKLFKCPIEGCDMGFSIQGNMKRHLNEMHDDDDEESSDKGKEKEKAKYVCEETGCGKVFLYLSRLEHHRKSHVKLDSSEAFCGDPGCMKYFSNSECLKAHVRSCHQHEICNVCGQKHLRKNMKRHLKTHEVHPLEVVKCHVEGCDHEFSKKSNLRQHIKAVHLQIKPYECSIAGCGMRFAFKHVRDKHEKSGCHSYVHGDIEEFDEQFRSRPRGGRKRSYPTTEMLTRKRVKRSGEGGDDVISGCQDYLSWLMSETSSDHSL